MQPAFVRLLRQPEDRERLPERVAVGASTVRNCTSPSRQSCAGCRRCRWSPRLGWCRSPSSRCGQRVVRVHLQVQVLVHLVTGHQIRYRIAALLQAIVAAVGEGDVVVHAALPVDVATDAQFFQRALEAVGRGEFERRSGVSGSKRWLSLVGLLSLMKCARV